MRRQLVTWSDRGADGPAPAHQAARPPSDRGPILRLLDETRDTYARAVVLTAPAGLQRTQQLAVELRSRISEVDVRVLDVEDPSDHAALFARMAPLARELDDAAERDRAKLDVLLSAGTPQIQTLWVILVQAAMLRARMLQVIPAAFVPKPHPRAIREVSLDVDGFPEIRLLREEVARLRAEVRARSSRLIAGSDPMRELLDRVARVARSELPVLVLGETGTGKELIARAIHDASPRAAGPFIAESCGALAEGVLASELFGHEAGAFTGAASRRRGLFEQASGGTIFLDEVGELPPPVQAMLLRVLQERTVRRVGGEQAVRVDVRVIAATHRDLERMVREGAFREDLYYRLRGATLAVPPLRERPSDLPAMIDAFLREAAGASGAKSRRLPVAPDAMRLLAAYPWPGNVRELRSEVHRWAVFCDERVEAADLAPEIRAGIPPAARAAIAARGAVSPGGAVPPRGASGAGAPGTAASTELATLAEVVLDAEHRAIAAALEAHGGNLSRTAKALAIERNTLKRKLAALGLRPAR